MISEYTIIRSDIIDDSVTICPFVQIAENVNI